jgi:hypothetical protein
MNDHENYLNPPESAIRERGARLSDMGPKLRATMERLHRDAAQSAAWDDAVYAARADEAIGDVDE